MTEDPGSEQPRYPDLAGKVAVVTGGSRGIGAATARALAANGAAVAIVSRDEEALAAVADDIQARGGRALAVRADCTVEADVSRAAQTIVEALGAADILAAFAGGSGMPVPTVQETADHWREVIEFGQPHDVAAATLFLASDASGWITGVTLDVAGGKIML